jgi:hypothetical protein
MMLKLTRLSIFTTALAFSVTMFGSGPATGATAFEGMQSKSILDGIAERMINKLSRYLERNDLSPNTTFHELFEHLIDRFDRDGDGRLNREELNRFLQALIGFDLFLNPGNCLSNAILNHLFDPDEGPFPDGFIDQEGYREFIDSLLRDHGRPPIDWPEEEGPRNASNGASIGFFIIGIMSGIEIDVCHLR